MGDPAVPNESQIDQACFLLGIPADMLRGQLRFLLWEYRVGQEMSVVGGVNQGASGLEIAKVPGGPFVISPLLGQTVDTSVSAQTNKARTWMFILGIPGALFLLCGLVGAVIALVRVFSP